jgi:hypothetical protein
VSGPWIHRRTPAFDVLDPVVITVGSLNAGNGSGTIPAEARLGITLRSFSPGTRERVRAGVRDLVNGIAAAHGPHRDPRTAPNNHAPDEVFDDAVLTDGAAPRRLEPVLEAAPDRPVTPLGILGPAWDDSEYRMGRRQHMDTAGDSLSITPPAVEATAKPSARKARKPKNGPVESRNHLDDLSPSLREYVLDRCRGEGIPVTSVRVVSATEVIFP